MFEFLKNLFSLNPQSPHKKRAGFLLLDVDEEASKMRLLAHGRKDGAREVPDSKEHRPGVMENMVIEVGKNLIQANTHTYEQEFQAYSNRLAILTPEGMLHDAQMQSRDHLSAIEALPTKHSVHLQSLKEKVAETQKQLKLFQHDNGLEDRAAHYPKSRILHFSFILVLLLIESALNATLLAKGNELGLLGGWTEAIIISVINVGALGMLICLGVRWLISRKRLISSLGFLTLVITALAAIGFNLATAHYRNQLGGESPELASILAWQSFLADPLALGDIKSMMLFVLGLAVVCLAAFDWLKMDDWYPGYGRVTRAHREALGEYAEFQGWLVHEQLQSLRDKASDVISKYLKMAASAASEDSQISGRIKTLNDRYRDSVDNIQTGVNALLQIYREANKASRDTDAPPSFQQDWTYSNEIVIKPLPQGRSMPDTQAFLDVLQPLQDELSKKYQRSLKLLNESVA